MDRILRAEQISKSYSDKQVLDEISFTLNRGELVSLLGVSGNGRHRYQGQGLSDPDRAAADAARRVVPRKTFKAFVS